LVARSITEVEYIAMILRAELLWLKSLLVQ
jgi:hypothetical protein